MTTEEPRQEEQGPLPRTREAVDWWLARWGRAEPLTREDVERLIEVNGGTPERLNLVSRDLQGADLEDANLQGARLRRANLQGARLRRANLQGADLIMANFQGANLVGVNLQGANLFHADLQGADLIMANLQGANLVGVNLQGANLFHADLQGAKLFRADLQGANLHGANLQGAHLVMANLDGANFEGLSEGGWTNMEGVRLYGATITDTTKLRRVRWGESMTLGEELDKRWGEALDPYRDLKQWHQRTGDYDTADRFQYREWECKRKLAQQEKKWWKVAECWLYRYLSGYGVQPLQVVLSGAVAVLLFTFLYMLPWVADLSLAGLSTFLQRFGKALYFSGVSFTAVGYGGWVVSGDVAPAGWTKYLGVVESLLGISLIALFLVTFTRKLVR